MALGNVYDPTQPQGGATSLEELLQDPEMLDLLSQMGYLPEEQGMPRGMQVGGTYKAPHPLEFASATFGNLIRNIKGPKMNRALAMALRGRDAGIGRYSGMSTALKPDPYDTELKPDPYGD